MSFLKTTIEGPRATIFLLTFIVSISISTMAFSQQSIVEENPHVMKARYIEGDNEALLFNVRYNNDSGSGFKLMVINEAGEVLFQNNYSGKNFKKKIRLTRLTDTDGVTFLISSPAQKIQLSYKVRVTTKVVEEPIDESSEL